MKFIDLFAGAGGLSLGLQRAGLTPILGVELNEDACNTYNSNLDHPCWQKDITKLTGEELLTYTNEKPDLLAGGPPCQGFSTIGKRDKKDERNNLVGDFIRIAGEIKPDFVLIENVLGMRDMDFVPHVEAALEDLGYTVKHFILTSADYGVPQLRRRIIFLGSLNSISVFKPTPILNESNYVSVFDAIGDLPALEQGQKAFDYTNEATTEFQKLMRNGCEVLQGHEASKHKSELVKAISFIPDGGNRTSIPDEYQPSSGFHNSYSRLNSKEPAVAITQNMAKPSGTRCVHPFQHRGLTAREGARLQSFPDSFTFSGKGTSQRLQIANAVPPLLAEAIGKSLFKSWATPEFEVVTKNEQMALAL
ncbi:MAG: DNA cytosine methyltransferase [Psychrobium sp.]